MCIFKRFVYLFIFMYIEYTVTVQKVVSHHVVAENWTQDLCSLRPISLEPKDLFIIICKYTVAVFRHTRRRHQIPLQMVVSHHVWLLGIELRTSACSSPKIYLLLYVSTLYLSSDTSKEVIRSHYGWLWVTIWLLGFELRTFRRAGSPLNC